MLRSMTGFGRAEGQSHGVSWVWELRAVNGKGLDLRMRLPTGYEGIEQSARKILGAALSRGNIQISLTTGRQAGAPQTLLNEEFLDGVLAAIGVIEGKAKVAPSSAADILAIRGVMDAKDTGLDGEDQEALELAILNSLQEATAGLIDNREQEGRALADVLSGLVRQIESLKVAAEEDPSRTPEAIGQRLKEQLSRIDTQDKDFDQDRLYQEVAVLATKADIREELDRLDAHTAAAHELIAKGSPVGRKLEFLAQEFNRESNTLCSKSNAVSLTNIGLELKVVVDQFKEQCLNVE